METTAPSARRRRRTAVPAQAVSHAHAPRAPLPSSGARTAANVPQGRPVAEGKAQILPAVLIDRSRKTYLRVMAGSKYCHLIPMDASGLSVLKLTEAECESLGLRAIDYALKKAVERFRGAGERFGITAEAATLLARLDREKIKG